MIPILLLILVAFTNYDQQHMPPTNLFSWVGLSNFITLFAKGVAEAHGQRAVYTTTNQVMANAQGKEVDLLVTWLFRLTQDYYNYKMASVIGIIVFIVCAVFTLFAFNFMTGGSKEEGYQ